MTINCECTECERNRSGKCTRGTVSIVATASMSIPAACDDYVCKEEDA